MKLLDLFCGAGGAAVGYHQAGFDEIVGVDLHPQPDYPFDFVQADALDIWWAHEDWDLIHASPPCQAYSTQGRNLRWGTEPSSPMLIAPVRDELIATNTPYVIENVAGARQHLRDPMIAIRGPDVGLNSIDRLRYFELGGWLILNSLPGLRNSSDELILGVYGRAPDGRRLSARRPKELLRAPQSVEEAQEAMGMPWVSDWRGIAEAIPPAYTRYLGEEFIAQQEAA